MNTCELNCGLMRCYLLYVYINMEVKFIYTSRNLDTRFCMVKYDQRPTENVNTFALIVLDSSLTDLVERTSHLLASKLRCCTVGNKTTH
jgi:hypothetical protein